MSLSKIWFALLLGTASVVSSASFGAVTCQDVAGAFTEKAQSMIASNNFTVSRGLDDYCDIFTHREMNLGGVAYSSPSLFYESLMRLGPNDLFLDGGCGDCVMAKDYLSSAPYTYPPRRGSSNPRAGRIREDSQHDRKLSTLANVVGISYGYQGAASAFDGKLKVLKGRFFEEIPDAELGRPKVISDVYGILSYYPQPDEVVRRYVRVGTPDVEIFAVVGYIDGRQRPGFMTSLPVTLQQFGRTRDIGKSIQTYIKVQFEGKTVDFATWLIHRTRGLKVEPLLSFYEQRGVSENPIKVPLHVLSLHIAKIDGIDVHIPKLRLKDRTGSLPPKMLLEEVPE